jgi:hypothetical protein
LDEEPVWIRITPVASAPDLLERIGTLVRFGRYRVRLHATRHMIEEGFDEGDIIAALTSRGGRILEEYGDQQRCLIVGTYPVGRAGRMHLHVVCDYSDTEIIDIVTAYIPQRPWWVTPYRRGRVQ